MRKNKEHLKAMTKVKIRMTPSKYAKKKGLSPGRITQLKDKLETESIDGRWFVIDCDKSDKALEEAKSRRKY